MPSTITDRLNGLTTSVAVKAPCTAVASTNITLAGLQTIGAVTVESGDRVLLIGQTDQTENGIYVADSGDWERARDFDGNRDAVQGTLVLVRNQFIEGAFYELSTANPVRFGSSSIIFRLRDSPNVDYDLTQAEIDAGVTPTNYAYPERHVWRYMTAAQIASVTAGDRSLDLAAAFRSARDVARQYDGVLSGGNGAEVYFPRGTYAVSELDFSTATTNFENAFVLRGDGHTSTAIVPFAAGKVLLNLKGTNQFTARDFTIDSRSAVSQYGVYISRTTTSDSANNNQFVNFRTIGSYSVTSFASFGAESTHYENCKFENANASALYKTFITGPRPSDYTAANTVNGGTVDSGPNTDNTMLDCEFYSPYAGAEVIEISESAGYRFVGCTLICYNAGGAGNVKAVNYSNPVTGVWNGPVIWEECHFELFGTGNVVHFLDTESGQVQFNGISSIGGHYVIANDTSLLDFERTNIASQAILSGSRWENPSVSPGITGSSIYLYGLYSSNIVLKPANTDGVVAVFGLMVNSQVETSDLRSPATITGNVQRTYGTATPTAGTYCQGHIHHNITPSSTNNLFWVCTVTGTLGALAGGSAVGSINSGSNQLGVSSATGHYIGARITIAGVTGVKTIRAISGTTLYLDSNANASVAGAAIAFSPGTFLVSSPVGYLEGIATYDPPSLADGVGATTTVTVAGAALGYYASASFNVALQGILMTPEISSSNTASVRFQNETGGVLDLASGNLRVRAEANP